MAVDPWYSQTAFQTKYSRQAPSPPPPPPSPPPSPPEEESGWEFARKWLGGGLVSDYLMGLVEPPSATQLKPGAISFETIMTSAVTSDENKMRLVKAYYPDRVAEAEVMLLREEYDLPKRLSPEEEAMEKYRVGAGEEEGIPVPEGLPEQFTNASGQVMRWNPSMGDYIQIGFDPSGVYQPPEEPSREPTRYDPWGQDPYGGKGQFNPYTGQWEPPADYAPSAAQPQWRTGELELQQQQAQQQAQYYAWQQAEAERQYGAQLAAQPRSWLEYSAYTGEQPAIQPWMIPLMGQQYAGTVAGAPLPGWGGGAPDMSQLPSLTRPSRQYQARMGPTAQQQYLGYQQARTGALPEETQWRLQQTAPPSGQHQGLSWIR